MSLKNATILCSWCYYTFEWILYGFLWGFPNQKVIRVETTPRNKKWSTSSTMPSGTENGRCNSNIEAPFMPLDYIKYKWNYIFQQDHHFIYHKRKTLMVQFITTSLVCTAFSTSLSHNASVLCCSYWMNGQIQHLWLTFKLQHQCVNLYPELYNHMIGQYNSSTSNRTYL